MSGRDDESMSFARELFGSQSERISSPSEAAEVAQGNYVPNEGNNPRARSNLSWDMREWVEELFHGGGYPS